MSNIVHISEAATLALHAMILLASNPDRPASTGEIAETLHGSEAHLSKVLQRLGREGLVKSTRGPGGGFVLDKPAYEITLLEIYEAIEGPLTPTGCLLNLTVCGNHCIFGGLLESIGEQVRDHLTGKKLSDVVIYKFTEEIHAEKNR